MWRDNCSTGDVEVNCHLSTRHRCHGWNRPFTELCTCHCNDLIHSWNSQLVFWAKLWNNTHHFPRKLATNCVEKKSISQHKQQASNYEYSDHLFWILIVTAKQFLHWFPDSTLEQVISFWEKADQCALREVSCWHALKSRAAEIRAQFLDLDSYLFPRPGYFQTQNVPLTSEPSSGAKNMMPLKGDNSCATKKVPQSLVYR